MEDVLSDIFRRIQLKSCVYFKKDFASPWGMGIDAKGMAQFHHVTRGQCVLQMAGESYPASAGDIFLLPRGGNHCLLDKEGSAFVAGQEVIASLQSEAPLFSSGDMATQLICGHYDYRGDLQHPLISQLPDVLHLKAWDMSGSAELHILISLIIGELSDTAPGVSIIVEKLAEIILVKLLRLYLKSISQPKGFLAALGDRRLVKSLEMIHAHSNREISLEDLAAAAGMSRSSFAFHFKAVTGLTPAAYLARWRMFLACDLLKSGEFSIGQIAQDVGYESDISFARAFKRHLNVTPAEYRRHAG